MAKGDTEFLKKLQATFQVEADDHLKAISSGLLELEKTPAAHVQMKVIESIYREIHSLKGAARAINLGEIETICHSLESTFVELKHKGISLSPALLDELHEAVGRIEKCLGQPPAGPLKESQPARKQEEIQEDVSRAEVQQLLIEPKPVQAETVRIAITKLDSLLLQAEELLAAKLIARQHVLDLRELKAAIVAWKSEWAKIQLDMHLLRQSLERNSAAQGHGHLSQELDISLVTPMIEFLDWNSSHIKALENRITALNRAAERDQRLVGGMVDNILEDMKKVVMLPFSWLLEVFPNFVRRLARDQGKEVDLLVQGGDIEMDRRILEELKDPLIHIVRNSIDHGIEKPEERIKRQKATRGTVTIAISQKNGNKIEVLITDDGPGVNVAKVKLCAAKLGIISEEEAAKMSEPEALELAFHSDVSTSPIITDISGRGIGLTIVREKIDKLGGTISLATIPGKETSFRILLPLTLATFRGILVQLGEQIFVVPAASVERVTRIKKDDIRTVENRETIQLNGQAIPLVSLDDVLDIPRIDWDNSGSDIIPVFVVAAADKYIAFRVNNIVNEQEVLVKSLGRQLSRVRNIAGATVLGNGQVVAILNVYDLTKSAVNVSAAPRREIATPKEVELKKKSILVAEDSITARTLLKNILETSGYLVRTAVDGVDAFTELRSGDFDLVVSDVDMPRMSGLDLTAKIRADKRYSQTPVVLVTALDSQQDRERGIDVGANAYIVKSSFDQSNLLEVIRRLV